MTENPSAEALEIADLVYTWGIRRGAEEIDALVKQRVSAERNWWQNRERQRLEQISTLQKTVQGFQRAQDERPAPAPVVDYTERAREIVSDWQIQVSPEGWLDTEFDELRKLLATALSDVASEHEETAYQAGVSDTRARLREADVREAIISEAHRRGLPSAHPWVLSSIDAALTKIAEI